MTNKKRRRTHDQDPAGGAKPHHSIEAPAPTAPESRARTILALQAQISYELQRDEELARHYASLAGREVATAATELGQALRSKRPLLSSLAQREEPSRGAPVVGKDPWTDMGLPSLEAYLDGPTVPVPALPECLDAELERIAFVHWSTLPQQVQRSRVDQDYERLELAGDAWVQLAATRLLAAAYPHLAVGGLCELRETLVRNETLAEFALLYGFDERATIPTTYLQNRSRGMAPSAMYRKILGDMFEAYVAAVVQGDPEHGFRRVELWLCALWRRKLPRKEDMDELDVAAKESLAKKLLGKEIRLEYFDVGAPRQMPGKLICTTGVRIHGWGWDGVELGRGEDVGKSKASTRAAMAALTNPLTGQIAAIKREYDALVKKEREREGGPDEEVLKELDRAWKGKKEEEPPAAAEKGGELGERGK